MNENIESCQREKRTYDEEGVREAVRLFLKSIGEDPEREGLVETPDR
ncbi:GTP cyclohydrolase I FolE, partial [Bifidobacterium longum]